VLLHAAAGGAQHSPADHAEAEVAVLVGGVGR
jgi:hypothetical protein